ncbi:pantoate--beta-alanine ligase [Peribacillus deserti]|uniref:Pantothenate synthetase n=1 Tax=Peribacillus deserti TaxID=673318 RepID=A0ABS2QJC2_9BACI|nr:pantoate--beta-alanine ligase [Peribacillus deserti]MBM7692618.1 pantoate--beta-alanine ligase [Peribacillus deserti]
MKVIKEISLLREALRDKRKDGSTVGFVPTMGFLHEGHQSLLKRAREENDIVVLSVFVNPIQFGPNEDFETYPRDIERDEQAAYEAGVDFIFYPSVEEMYPHKAGVSLIVNSRTNVLCGAKRPGHFDGVVTVLTKLFNIIQPDQAYFGLKDAQQVAVIDSLIRDFNIPVELVPVNTVREEDGLAKSSRNVFLSEEERQQAPAIFKSLQKARALIDSGERNPEKVIAGIKEELDSSTSGEIDYAELLSYPELERVEEIQGKIIIALAVKFSRARLIDNIIVEI